MIHDCCVRSSGDPAHWRRTCVSRRSAQLVALSVLYSGQALANSGLEDKIADVVVWVVVIVVPIVGVVAFWIVHIWPERVAEQKHHSQAAAIQALCLLSLVFGGLLWAARDALGLHEADGVQACARR